MKRALRAGGILLALLGLLVGVALAYLFLFLPRRYPVPQVALPTQPQRLENGRYLANHVALCTECHSLRKADLYAAPVDEATLGAGGESFAGDFGVLYAPNITPTGLANWSDQDLYRAVATGVTKDGRALFPLMPYVHYAHSDPKDLQDILAYVRSLQPKPGTPSASKLNFPLNLIVRTMPGPLAPTQRPQPGTPKYGAYLTEMASCTDCHTPMDKGAPIPGLAFAGGREFPIPSGIARSANITPDKETGIGNWTRDRFVQRFKSPQAAHNTDTPLKPGQVNTIMPWRSYAGMTEEDLGTIYDYLMTLPAVKNRVPPPAHRPAP